MIDTKYIKEALRLAPICLQDAQTYSDWQYALYCAELELERFRKEQYQYFKQAIMQNKELIKQLTTEELQQYYYGGAKDNPEIRQQIVTELELRGVKSSFIKAA